MAHAAQIRSPHSAMILFQIGGALNCIEDAHSPVGNRDARYVLNIGGSWEQAAGDAANIAWARAAWDDLKAFSTGGAYINFMTQDEGPARIQAALGSGRGFTFNLADVAIASGVVASQVVWMRRRPVRA